MVLSRLFGRKPAPAATADPVTPPDTAAGETQTVRRIVAQLEALSLEERRFVAGYAYVLGRAAHADLVFGDEEIGFIERTVQEVGHLTEAQAVLVVEIARAQEELYGATEDYLVTREFTRLATPEQRADLLRTAFAVGAVDGSISAVESAELNEIGKELGFTAEEVDRIRLEFADSLAAIQQMRRMAAEGASGDVAGG